MQFVYNDGGRKAAGFKGTTGDCVTRAIAIATDRPYIEVYNALARLVGQFAKCRSKRARHAAKGNYLGLAAVAAVNPDTVVAVNINVPQPVSMVVATGNASGGGLLVDTGLGATPTGMVIVQSRDTTGAPRTMSSLTWGSGGNLGKVTIVTSAGASSDTHHIIAVK
jgi:hypothetical protein